MTLTALALAGIGIVLISRAEENRREQTEHKREENHIPALRERLKELEQRMAHMQGQQETLASQREEKRKLCWIIFWKISWKCRRFPRK